MRAKMVVQSVAIYGTGEYRTEKLTLCAVAKSSGYPSNGSDEDNTYAKFSPSATLEISIANPALHGKFQPGQKFYIDFTEVT